MSLDVGLAPRVRRGALWGAVGVAVPRALQLVTTVVLARLLAPEAFGVLAVAITIQTVALNASELGATAALGRGSGDPDRVAPTVWTIALATSTGLTALMWVLAGPLAMVLGNPGAAPAVRVMSLTVLLAGVSAVPTALIWREFLQGRRLLVELAGIVVTGVSAVALALAGWDAMALAASRLAGAVVTTALFVAVSPRRYRPGFDRSEARAILRLGLPLAAANLVVFVTLNLDYVVVGRQLGARELGVYLLVFNLAALPSTVLTQILRTVAVPVFGRLHAAGTLRGAVGPAVALVCGACVGAAAVLAAVAGPALAVLYGPVYAAAAGCLVALCVFSAARVMTEVLSDLSVGAGRTGLLFWVQVVWCIALLPAMLVGVGRAGIVGAAVAHAVVAWVVVVPCAVGVVCRTTGAPVRDVVRAAWRPVLAGVAAAAAGWVVAQWWGPAVLSAATGALVALAVYLLAVHPVLLGAVRSLGLAPAPLPSGGRRARPFLGRLW